MPKSTVVFIQGTAIDVGAHGVHDHVFASGEPVTDGGDSTLVFESGTGLLRGTVIDDWEDQDLDEYEHFGNGSKADFTIQDAVVSPREGAWALRAEDPSALSTAIRSDSGLTVYPERGDEFRIDVYNGDQTNLEWNVDWAFDLQDTDHRYSITHIPQADGDFVWQLFKNDPAGTSDEVLAEKVNPGLPEGSWYTYRVEYDVNGNGDINVFAEQLDGTQITTLSGNDTEFTSRSVGVSVQDRENSGTAGGRYVYYDNWELITA